MVSLRATQIPSLADLDSLNSIHLNSMEFRRFDKSRDGLISREEYDNLTRAANQVHSKDPDQEPRDKFAAMDADSDHFISLSEFRFNYVRDTIAWPAPSHSNIVYKKIGEEFLLLDILMPTNLVYDKAPVLYFVHGGGFRSGAKEYLRLNDLRAETALQFAERGFCCVSVRYRLVNLDPDKDTVLIGECVTDSWDGLRYLKEHAEDYQLDPDKIIVWGESAGGHLAQMLTFSDPEDFPGDPGLAKIKVNPAAGISWYGPSDFTGTLDKDKENSPLIRHARHITGKSTYTGEDMETLKEVSPYFLIDSSDPPLLLMQGDSDHAVPLSHATGLKAGAKEVDVNLELLVVKNAGHNWRQVGDDPIEPSKTELREIMLSFAEKSLDLK